MIRRQLANLLSLFHPCIIRGLGQVRITRFTIRGGPVMLVRNWVTLAASVAVAMGFVLFPRARAQDQVSGPAKAKQAKPSDDPTARLRNRMVQRHLVERGIKNPRVLDAFRTVPRHRFLAPKTQRLAYDDESIPIGEGQTITPPYDVAFMTEVLDPKPSY